MFGGNFNFFSGVGTRADVSQFMRDSQYVKEGELIFLDFHMYFQFPKKK